MTCKHMKYIIIIRITNKYSYITIDLLDKLQLNTSIIKHEL